MKVVIAVDSFKGSLSSMEAGRAAKAGILAARPDASVIVKPLADGGEGTTDALVEGLNGKKIDITVTGPLGQPVSASYGYLEETSTAVIEMAAAAGITLVPPDEKDPLSASTYGVGEMISDALVRGCRNFIIGIGGSATNDAGLGMLQALGFRFLDKEGKILETGNGKILMEVVSIDTSFVHPDLRTSHFTVACDVQNPFYGLEGAAYIFAPQKGADRKMVEALDAGMKNFAEVIFHTTGKDISNHSGTGAAGGMGGSLLAFLNAKLKPGIQLMLETLDFSNKIKGADLIITGEGKADKQTLMGKVPSGILDKARKQKIPVILIAGSVENADDLHRAGFRGVYSINPPSITLEQAMQPEVARANISETVVEICRSF